MGGGGVSGYTEHTGHSASYPGGAALTMGGASSVPHDSQKLSAAPTGAPHDGQMASDAWGTATAPGSPVTWGSWGGSRWPGRRARPGGPRPAAAGPPLGSSVPARRARPAPSAPTPP